MVFAKMVMTPCSSNSSAGEFDPATDVFLNQYSHSWAEQVREWAGDREVHLLQAFAGEHAWAS
jgi:hypothetical protein